MKQILNLFSKAKHENLNKRIKTALYHKITEECSL